MLGEILLIYIYIYILAWNFKVKKRRVTQENETRTSVLYSRLSVLASFILECTFIISAEKMDSWKEHTIGPIYSKNTVKTHPQK